MNENSKQQSGYVPFSQKLNYSISSGGGNIITTILGTFVSAYMTDSLGIAAAAAGTMMLVIRFLDLGTDFLMGGLIDRTHTRWGKCRPWLFVSAPLTCVSLILLFGTPENLDSSAKLIYCYIMYFFINAIGFTIFIIPHTSLLSRLTLNGLERAKIASMEQILNQITALTVTTFWVPLVGTIGYRWTACIYGIATAVLILFGFFGTRETIDEEKSFEKSRKDSDVPFKTAIKYVVKNKYFWLETSLFGLLLIHNFAVGSVMYYYTANILHNTGYVAILSACGMVAATTMNLILPMLIKRFGKRRVLISGALAIIITSTLMGMFSSIPIIIIILAGIKGFFMGGMFACAFALTGDVVDYGEWKFGVRSEGLVNAGNAIGQKIGLGLGPAIASWIIGFAGYNGMAKVQTASALSAINFSYTYLAAIVGLLILIVCIFFDVDKNAVTIQKDLSGKHSIQ